MTSRRPPPVGIPLSEAGITFVDDFYSVGSAGTRSVLFYGVFFYDTGQALTAGVLKLSRVVRRAAAGRAPILSSETIRPSYALTTRAMHRPTL